MKNNLELFNSIIGKEYSLPSNLFEASRHHKSILVPFDSIEQYGYSQEMLHRMGDKLLFHYVTRIIQTNTDQVYFKKICISNHFLYLWLKEMDLIQFCVIEDNDTMNLETVHELYGNFFESILASIHLTYGHEKSYRFIKELIYEGWLLINYMAQDVAQHDMRLLKSRESKFRLIHNYFEKKYNTKVQIKVKETSQSDISIQMMVKYFDELDKKRKNPIKRVFCTSGSNYIQAVEKCSIQVINELKLEFCS